MSKVFLIASDSSQNDLRKAVFERLHEVSRIKVISVEINDDSTWYSKPSLIIDALKEHKQVCWLDCDIEILKNFDEIFDLPSKGIAGVQDAGYPESMNTGVLVIDPREYAIMSLWSAMCNMRYTRSDQEALDALRKQYPDSFEFLPEKYNHQRLSKHETTEDTAICHWTGPEGKVILRNKLAR